MLGHPVQIDPVERGIERDGDPAQGTATISADGKTELYAPFGLQRDPQLRRPCRQLSPAPVNPLTRRLD
jgi:hypothetical protein